MIPISSEKKRQAIYDFIAQYIEKEQVSPTIREIVKSVEVSSTSHAAYHLHELRRRGLITWQEGKMRTIRLVGRH